MDQIQTVIIGGGQAGLATSYHLKALGREHVVLEQAAHPANVWREGRWDSFTLVTPNWSFKMPGAEYNGADPDGFMPRDEVISVFDQYVAEFELPVQCNTRVLSVVRRDGGYRVEIPDQQFQASNVVIATGYYQQPKIPAYAADLAPAITQLHSSAYRNPGELPPGGVLVVGSAQSGCQIAEELYQHGRKVFLSTGCAGRAPRCYRGKDVIAWLDETGFFNLTPEQLPPPMSKFGGIPHFSGTHGGHSLNLHQFARDGVTLLGHIRGGSGERIAFAPDLSQNLEFADSFERDATTMIDGFISANGLDAPPEELPQLRDGFEQPVIEEVDLSKSGITTIIWAMGYARDYGLVKLPVCDDDGFPIQTSGVTDFPGLYFAGMPWMPTEKSGFLIGVGEATRHIAESIAERDVNGRRTAKTAA